MRRRKVSRSKSKKMFRKTAGFNKKNARLTPMRGGIRL